MLRKVLLNICLSFIYLCYLKIGLILTIHYLNNPIRLFYVKTTVKKINIIIIY